MNLSSLETVCMRCFTQQNAPFSVCPACGCAERTDAPPHLLRPRTILNGKYLLGNVLGEGGFGITYIGWDLNLHLKVAIKEYYPTGFVTRETTSSTTVQPFAGSQGDYFLKVRDKFVNEARTLAKFFSLPGIVAVKDYFLENGTAYIVMEYVEGQTLKDYLAKMGGKLPSAQVFEMMRPVMSSLAEIHKTGLIHRDISPDNIMISKDGYMKLLDFGAAREFSESGNLSMTIMLKPGFAPEEQYRTKGVQGPWTDIYALCATMYKCITGITPEESVERIHNDATQPPSALGIPIEPQKEAAMLKGMSVLQRDRFQTVAELNATLYAGGYVPAMAGVPPAPPMAYQPTEQKQQPSVSATLHAAADTVANAAGKLGESVGTFVAKQKVKTPKGAGETLAATDTPVTTRKEKVMTVFAVVSALALLAFKFALNFSMATFGARAAAVFTVPFQWQVYQGRYTLMMLFTVALMLLGAVFFLLHFLEQRKSGEPQPIKTRILSLVSVILSFIGVIIMLACADDSFFSSAVYGRGFMSFRIMILFLSMPYAIHALLSDMGKKMRIILVVAYGIVPLLEFILG